MSEYKHFIPENVAPKTARRIGIYNETGNRVGFLPLGSLDFPSGTGDKLYSFGALSDVHWPYTTGEADFIRALNYLNNEAKVDLICISGDLTEYGTDEQLSHYKELVDTYAPNTPVYVSAGNHDAILDDSWEAQDEEAMNAKMQTYTGNPLYYAFERENDVFIFVGLCKDVFSLNELQWLYETLEKYRNKRCFLFQHSYASEGCGDVFGLYNGSYLNHNNRGKVFKSLLKHYHNIVWFHGHSHTEFRGQEFGDLANYDYVFGCHSVHVPSCAVPRTDADGDGYFQIEQYASEGHLVDVYENGIYLRGRDFVKGEFLPIASYWLDTTIQTIEAGTYTDETATIITQESEENV